MTNDKWRGILKILNIRHSNALGETLWQDNNVLNTLHADGEEFLLRTAFTGDPAPESFYLGLDNRESVEVSQKMEDLVEEPFENGYERIQLSSSSDFSVDYQRTYFVARSPIVKFRAIGGSWGPVSNLFLTDRPGHIGYLIATAAFEPITLEDGDEVTMRIGVALKDESEAIE